MGVLTRTRRLVTRRSSLGQRAGRGNGKSNTNGQIYRAISPTAASTMERCPTIALFFAISPAVQGARLDPIDALRYSRFPATFLAGTHPTYRTGSSTMTMTLEITPEAAELIRRRGGSAAVDFLPPIG